MRLLGHRNRAAGKELGKFDRAICKFFSSSGCPGTPLRGPALSFDTQFSEKISDFSDFLSRIGGDRPIGTPLA